MEHIYNYDRGYNIRKAKIISITNFPFSDLEIWEYQEYKPILDSIVTSSNSLESADPTIHLVLPYLSQIFQKINVSTVEKTLTIESFKLYFPFYTREKILDGGIYLVSCCLHPNLKTLNYIPYTALGVNNMRYFKKNIYKFTKNFLIEMATKIQLRVPQCKNIKSTSFLDDLLNIEKPKSLDEEITQFLNEQAQSAPKILEFWKIKKEQYPLLGSLVKIIFSVPASSACSERSFSIIKRILTSDRCSLSDKTIESCI